MQFVWPWAHLCLPRLDSPGGQVGLVLSWPLVEHPAQSLALGEASCLLLNQNEGGSPFPVSTYTTGRLSNPGVL